MAQLTLNGIAQDIAASMIKNFRDDIPGYPKPPIVNFILKKEMVLRIVDLLTRERTEGFRIHFGRKEGSSALELLLVSARYYKTDANGQQRYRDYYDHDENDILFTDTDLDIISVGKDDPGALLYNTASEQRDPNCFTTDMSSFIDVDFAKSIIARFGDHEFNTWAVWFSAGTFFKMANEKDCDGIRVYLATYPPDYYVEDYQNRDTIVLTTAKKDEATGLYTDYFHHSAQNHEQKVLMGDPQNHGSICPDMCD